MVGETGGPKASGHTCVLVLMDAPLTETPKFCEVHELGWETFVGFHWTS